MVAQETNKNPITKIYGSKEKDSEIDFEEEPRIALICHQSNEESISENDDNYLLPKLSRRSKSEIRKK
jgi:hypothetical protein